MNSNPWYAVIIASQGDIPVILFGSSDVVWKKRTDVVVIIPFCLRLSCFVS